jgi:hypothetical protein
MFFVTFLKILSFNILLCKDISWASERISGIISYILKPSLYVQKVSIGLFQLTKMVKCSCAEEIIRIFFKVGINNVCKQGVVQLSAESPVGKHLLRR